MKRPLFLFLLFLPNLFSTQVHKDSLLARDVDQLIEELRFI